MFSFKESFTVFTLLLIREIADLTMRRLKFNQRKIHKLECVLLASIIHIY